MNDANHIAENYIAAWNETDAATRRARLGDGWATGASYADRSPARKG